MWALIGSSGRFSAKAIFAIISFDFPLLIENDRGRLIGETAAWLRGLL